ncbi:methyltransferase domain-containing protein [Psychrosphaera ytuae]|uniref:Methyltransferase domain-containing protein n=1 Tax=Psychrosphaera ytuae TaxID=2820710 RepID=A0A975HJ14_9GAMM|nr:methyltransferase domain-containing protein [Psychrosphaera ytuae]QTH64845.1 methyltransferase domain-containing protein [Psychrosphaera ytuae]
MTLPAAFSCPLCSAPLSRIDNTLKCEQNHSFDYAKEGYVNLLPVQQKKSLQPGDDKDMVLARRAFLQTGAYEFLQQSLVDTIKKLSPQTLVDLGCGEGYYTDAIQVATSAQTYGIDISKAAVKYAAKRNKGVHYAVATNAHLPFTDQQIDVIANVFAPLVGEECQRILTDQGCIVSVAPGPDHLIELKKAIYSTPEQHTSPTPPVGFDVVEQQRINKTITLTTASAVSDLLTMTPFGWKISAPAKQNILANLPFSVTLDFVISQFKVVAKRADRS